jgi:putative endonuclease
MAKTNFWFVYMIRCDDGSLYTGCTNHVIRRWHQHREGKGAKYLRAHKPEEVVFVEKHLNRSSACKREYEIKQMDKTDKERLVESKRSSSK